MLVASVAERATAKLLTDVIRVLLFPMLVAKAALTAANSASVTKPEPSPITELIEVIAFVLVVILVLLFPMLVAKATDVAANSASVTNPEPSPITELIEVIASRLVFVNTDTAATSVTFAAETPAIRSSSASILVAETIPKD